MIRIDAGPGIVVNQRHEYDYSNGQSNPILVVEVSMDMATRVEPYNISTSAAQEGDILTVDNYGSPVWKAQTNPLEEDEYLRSTSVTVDEAWKTLMKALADYEMAKKLVKE